MSARNFTSRSGGRGYSNLRLVNVMGALLGAHESRVSGVHEHVGMSLLDDVAVEVSRVEKARQFAPAILPIWTSVLVYFVDTCELGVPGRALVRIAGLVADSHNVPLLGGLLHQRQQIARQYHVAHVVHGHVPIDAIVGQLGGHDSATAIVDQDVKPVRAVPDCLGHLLSPSPVAEIALHPDDAVRLIFSELFCDSLLGSIDDVLETEMM